MTTIPPPTQVLVQTNRKAVPVWYDFFRTLGSSTIFSTTYLTLEQFGASGDGVHDDGPAFRAAWVRIGQQGGGYIVLGTGKTYYINVSSLADQAVYTTVSNLSGTGIIGNGATIKADAVYTGAKANYLLWFNGCSDIVIRDLNIVAFAEASNNTTAFRGLSMFIFAHDYTDAASSGCRRVVMQNIKQTGGRHIGWASTRTTAPITEQMESRFFDISNIEAITVHYPLEFKFGHKYINIRNLRTSNPNRSLFIHNTKHLYAQVNSTGHADDDCLLIAANTTEAFSSSLEDINIDYSAVETTDVGAAVALVLNQDTGSGATMRNVKLNFHVDAGNPVNYVACYCFRSDGSGADVGGARGHIAEGITISGVLWNLPSSQVLNLFPSFPAGEKATDIRVQNFSTKGVYSLLTHDTTCLVGNAAYSDVRLDPGDLQLTGTPTGQVHLKTLQTNNGFVQSNAFAKMVVSGGVYVTTAL